MPDLVIARDDPTSMDVAAVLEAHLTFARGHSPPEDVHALDVDGLVSPDVQFFSAREDGALLGVGALKRLGRNHGELKSLHTVEHARGMGVGRSMVAHLLDVAASSGMQRVSLETGSMDAFAPSRALYASLGFEPCEPFAGYRASSHSVFMTIRL